MKMFPYGLILMAIFSFSAQGAPKRAPSRSGYFYSTQGKLYRRHGSQVFTSSGERLTYLGGYTYQDNDGNTYFIRQAQSQPAHDKTDFVSPVNLGSGVVERPCDSGNLQEGDIVEITEGNLEGFVGEFHSIVAESNQAVVLISMFHRTTVHTVPSSEIRCFKAE